MSNKKTPLTIEGINESIYADFWTRSGSLILDFLIMSPYLLLILYTNILSLNTYYITSIVSIVFHFWFNIYLVKKYGGTPGKLILGIKIIKINGSEVTWKEAILRDIIHYILIIFAAIVTYIAISKADVNYYNSLQWREKLKYIYSLTPILLIVKSYASNIWTFSELLVLLFNARKRALHDYMAGTVVVKKKYINDIRNL